MTTLSYPQTTMSTAAPVTGIDRLVAGEPADLAARLRSSKLGFITNDLALTSGIVRGRIALRDAGFDIRLFFAPEHGLAGRAREGEVQSDSLDPEMGVPVRSLYGDTLAPQPEDLAQIDALLYDLPDVGSRFYTYLWTLSYALEACAASGTPIVVLDRPNPIGGLLDDAEGPWLDEENCTSFIGRWRMPLRHSLTIGELARWWVKSRNLDVDLTVIETTGWSRERKAIESDAHWTPPSPNLPDPVSVVLYPGTCLFEGLNLAEGRSTPVPFRVLGAPWIDAAALAKRIEELEIPGLRATPYGFTPFVRDYAGESCEGVLFAVTDHHVLRPVSAIVRVLAAIEELHPGMLQERQGPPVRGESPRTSLEKLFGRMNAFAEITSGTWNDPSLFDVSTWKDDVESVLLYR
jgi:uncharacterized protein YbbC (DUF1343 family)